MSTTTSPTSAGHDPAVADAAPSPGASRQPRLRWWVEMLTIIVCYELYSLARNTQGSRSVSADVAFRNARALLRLEHHIGLGWERPVQRVFLHAEPLVKGLNIFYGSAHFIVTVGVLVWLFFRQSHRYRMWRWALATTTLLALIGFTAFPLMPPRLLPVEERAQALVATHPGLGHDAASRQALVEVRGGTYRSAKYPYDDTLETIGGLWNFESGAIAKLSNQYAAMPSLHFAWSMWCACALVPGLRRRGAKALAIAHPVLTGTAIVATANHYVLDAVAGAATLAIGIALAHLFVGGHLRRPTRR